MRWKHSQPGDCQPYWIIESSNQLIIDTIQPALTLLKLDTYELTITWLAEGGWHKVYTASARCSKTGKEKSFVLRIALPAYPYYKVESDVATTELIRHFTNIPVPIIYCYDSSANNPLGLEWMLMKKVEANALSEVWNDLDNDDHITLSCQLASWVD